MGEKCFFIEPPHVDAINAIEALWGQHFIQTSLCSLLQRLMSDSHLQEDPLTLCWQRRGASEQVQKTPYTSQTLYAARARAA